MCIVSRVTLYREKFHVVLLSVGAGNVTPGLLQSLEYIKDINISHQRKRLGKEKAFVG